MKIWIWMAVVVVMIGLTVAAQQPARPAPLDPVLDLALTRIMVLENRVSLLTARLEALEKKAPAPAKR